MIDKPGVYEHVDEEQYHTDQGLAPTLGRSLSQSGAKTLLRSPAHFAWERDHGRPPKREFDLGGVVHALVLRSHDSRIRVIDAYDWRTKAAQEARRAAWDARLTPVNRTELLQAARIAAAVRRDPLARAIFSEGRPEVTVYWTDDETGVTCRSRIDWVRDDALVDLKTTRYGGTVPDEFGRSAAKFDYPMQGAVYTEGWQTVTGEQLPFITVAVEVEPPYLVHVGFYTDEDIAAGRAKWRRALAEYADRESSGDWSRPLEVQPIPVPPWYAHTA